MRVDDEGLTLRFFIAKNQPNFRKGDAAMPDLSKYCTDEDDDTERAAPAFTIGK